MRLLFVHDHVFKNNNNVFYSDKLPYSILSRYLRYFSSLVVFARYESNNSYFPDISRASGEHVSFVTAENISRLSSYSGSRGRQFKKLNVEIERCDAVIARLPSQYGMAAVYMAKRLNKPVLVEIVSCAWDSLWHHGGIKAKLYAGLFYWKMKKAVSISDYALYVSNRYLQYRYPCTGESIGVSDVEIQKSDDSVLATRLVKIEKDNAEIRIGLIGSLNTRYKGVDVAIKAVADLRMRGFDASLHILGGGDSGPYSRLSVQLGIEDKVFFEGLLPPGEAVLNWLASMDIYIQPSLVEGMPRAVLEAMSQALPTVASTVGGIPELLDPDVLVKPGDWKDLAERLQSFISNPRLLKEQANNNFEAAKFYSKGLLDGKRDSFFLLFSKSVRAS